LDVKTQNFVGSTSQNATEITVTGLSAATDYSVYCFSESQSGTVMTYAVMLETVQVVRTACCRSIFVGLGGSSVSSDTSVLDFLSSRVSSLPSASLSVSFSVNRIGTNSSNLVSTVQSFNPFFPSSLSYSSQSSTEAMTMSLVSIPSGYYVLQVSLTGSLASDYEVVFTNGIHFTSISIKQPPSPPVLASAVFSGDGATLTITFNSATNQAKLPAFFNCEIVAISKQ